MAKVVFRQKAINDLNDIWVYTSKKWSVSQSDKYYATITTACKGIGEKPSIGNEYSGIQKNLFGLKSGKHIIFYQIMPNNSIEILRILHERMDLKNRIME